MNPRESPPSVTLIIEDPNPESFSAPGAQPARKVTPWLLQSRLPTYAKELVAGGVAGGIAKTTVAPLERIKILYQTKQAGFQEAGIWRSLKHLFRTEGLHGFYRGNGASVARVVPYAALHFMTYEQYRRWIVDCYHPTVQISPAVDLIAGSLAGATAVLFTYPLDLIRTRLAYQTTGITSEHRGILDAFRGILRQGGMAALYKGVGPTLWGILPYAGLKFYIYESLRDLFPDPGTHPVTQKLGCGAVAGVVAQTVTYPLDVVRRQMQVGEVGGMHRGLGARGTWGGVVSIVREQGWRQLFAGLHINYLKVVPSVAIGFTVYDSMRAWLKVPPRQKRNKQA